ncbi:hypothetical protein U3516DRAFT_737674 [Neocallimastix sp. 'constans']
MSPTYVNMGVCLTAIPLRPKKFQYRSTLCDPQGKAEPTIGGLFAIPEELETVILSDKAYAMGFLNYYNTIKNYNNNNNNINILFHSEFGLTSDNDGGL